MRWKKLLIAGLVCIAGCFDFEETLYLNPDGSGRGEIRYALPYKMLNAGAFDVPSGGIPLTEEGMREHFKTREGVRLTGGTYREEGPLKIIDVTFTFEDVRALSEHGMIFDWRSEGGERVFSITLHRAGKGQVNSPLRSMFLQNFETHGFRFNVYFPRKLSFSNAKRTAGNTARWFVPLSWMAEQGEKEKILEARFPMTTSERVKEWFNGLFGD